MSAEDPVKSLGPLRQGNMLEGVPQGRDTESTVTGPAKDTPMAVSQQEDAEPLKESPSYSSCGPTEVFIARTYLALKISGPPTLGCAWKDGDCETTQRNTIYRGPTPGSQHSNPLALIVAPDACPVKTR